MTYQRGKIFPPILIIAILLFIGHAGESQKLVHVEVRDGKLIYPPPVTEGHTSNTIARNALPHGSSMPEAITLNISIIPATCQYNNGTVSVTASGGTPPYTYTLDGWTQQSGYFPSVSPGNYTLLVTDAINATATSPVTMTSTTTRPLIQTLTVQDATACVSSTGIVTLTVSGGTPPYEYSKDNMNWQSSNVFGGLFPGMYNFFVRDANNCRDQRNNFSQFMHPPNCVNSLGYSQTAFACGPTGSVDNFQVFGPNPPYTFSLDGINYQASGSFNGLLPGVYAMYFKSAIGEVGVWGFNIYEYCYIQLDHVVASTLCNQPTGTVTLTASGGIAPYTYSMDGINYQASNVFTGLYAGWYYFKTVDASGATAITNVEVGDLCPTLTLSATGESCTGNDGTITATATGSAPFTYSKDGINFQSSNQFTGLSSGPYTITVKDLFGNIKTETINVPYTCLLVTTSLTHPTCGNSNGSITLTVSNGTPPYQYSLDGVNFQLSNIFSNLPAGNYTVTVKDNGIRTATVPFTLTDIPGPQLNTSVQPATCPNNNGSITISGTSGTIPYQYSLDGVNYQGSPIFSSLAAGNYTAWIKDANNCSASVSLTVTLHCPSISTQINHETCGNENGAIIASGSNGVPPYSWSIDGINYQASGSFTGLIAGTYTITIKDATGITNSASVTIMNSCPIVTAQGFDGYCGTANASIVATGANGSIPYFYSIDGTNFQLANNFTNLASGTYTVTVRDADGLTNTTTVTVQNFPGPGFSSIVTDASCVDNDGFVTLQGSGGAQPYTYSLNGSAFQSNPLFTQLTQGNYTAIIKDANGCFVTQNITVGLLNNLTLNTTASQSVCEGKSVQLLANSNGNLFTWTPSATLNNAGALQPIATPLNTTKYYISAFLGSCTKNDSVLVTVYPAPVADAGADITICYQQSVSLQGSGGLFYNWTPSTYLDDPASNQPLLINPRNTTTYLLSVTDNRGCSSVQPDNVVITVTPMPALSAGNDTVIMINEPYQLSPKDLNNSGFNTFTWTPSFGLSNAQVSNPVAIIDRDMTYMLVASTAAGCTANAFVRLKVLRGPDIIVPSAFTPNNDGLNDRLSAIPVGIKEFRHFTVYNRWGEIVFHTADAAKSWDGLLRSQKQDSNLFIWIAAGVDQKGNLLTRKGTVIMIR